ncbi:DUF3961 domain-containing protein [Bacillus sp. JJ1127]
MRKLNDYFGISTVSDGIWLYGFYVIGTLLFTASMLIAWVL